MRTSTDAVVGVPTLRAFEASSPPAELASRLFLLEIHAAVTDTRVLRLGDYLISTYGRDYTGLHYVDSEIPGITGSVTYRLLEALIETGAPQYRVGVSPFCVANWFYECEQILLPLADDEGQLGYVLGAIDFPAFDRS